MILSTASEHPIRLNSALTGQLVGAYPLVSPTTEAHIKPHSLLFSSDGATFLAGSENAITIFDVSRPGSEPLVSLRTGPKRNKNAWTNPVTALKGFVSAMDVDQQYNVLAAGTLSRQVGLYDHGGHGECIGVFSVGGTEADSVVSGSGITQAIWSRCGRYLHLAERKSNGTMVYDIRKTGQLLSWTVGRNAMTNQRMKVELAMGQGTREEDIVAGGTDGYVRRWKAPHLRGGAINCDSAMELCPNPVNSIGVHQLGNVLLTANGSRVFESPLQSSRLRLWALP